MQCHGRGIWRILYGENSSKSCMNTHARVPNSGFSVVLGNRSSDCMSFSSAVCRAGHVSGEGPGDCNANNSFYAGC